MQFTWKIEADGQLSDNTYKHKMGTIQRPHLSFYSPKMVFISL